MKQLAWGWFTKARSGGFGVNCCEQWEQWEKPRGHPTSAGLPHRHQLHPPVDPQPRACAYLFFGVLYFALLFYCPALVFALGALFAHIAGGPMFNLSSRLNITSAIARGIHTCQPLYSVCKLHPRSQAPALLAWEFTLKWKLSLKQGWRGSGRNQLLSRAAFTLYLLCAESLGLQI